MGIFRYFLGFKIHFEEISEHFFLTGFLIIHLVVISGLGSNILDHPPVRAEEWIKRNGIDK